MSFTCLSRHSGHVEFDPGCPKCRAAHGRMRPHIRLDMETRLGGQLSVDRSGPHLPGKWPSGRSEDAHKKAVHFLLGAYTIETSEQTEAREHRELVALDGSGVDPATRYHGHLLLSHIIATTSHFSEFINSWWHSWITWNPYHGI